MIRTLSEISATCSKAVKAAGCPWGMAEEAGLAARRLASVGLPGAEAVADLLTTPRQCACAGQMAAQRCGLAEMVRLMDKPPRGSVELGEIASPLLILGFALVEQTCWEIRWPGGSAICAKVGLTLYGDLPGPLAAISIAPLDDGEPVYRPDWRSRHVDPTKWRILETYAAQLLVPETTRSRATGAGPDATG
ncbi:MAG: DUF3726 domain-containing protein [Pseudomonadota bacterium]